MKKKLLDFQVSISDVAKLNPLFSTCKVRVMYVGKNRNMSTIPKESVEKAMPSLIGIPIVGEYSVENKDFKGHGGAIDLSDFKFIHTTKPYGFVPESAQVEWVAVKGADGTTHEYLEVSGCLLWTGRYEEALDVVQKGKNQSMEIEVIDGEWDKFEESYVIKDFIFSAFCILGDSVEPAFEDANITAYSLDRDSFKQEYALMLDEFKSSLSNDKEVNDMKLKELLEKYSLTVEQLTEKGIKFDEISEDDLEAKIIEVFEIKPEGGEPPVPPVVEPPVVEKFTRTFELSHSDIRSLLYTSLDSYVVDKEMVSENNGYFIVDVYDTYAIVEVYDYESVANKFYQVNFNRNEEDAIELQDNFEVFPMFMSADEKATIEQMRANHESMMTEMMELRKFKADIEKADKKAKVDKMFENFQLTEVDTEGLDIDALTLEEIEEKCYAILGRKLASNKNFTKTNNGIHLPLNGSNENHEQNSRYGNLFNK